MSGPLVWIFMVNAVDLLFCNAILPEFKCSTGSHFLQAHDVGIFVENEIYCAILFGLGVLVKIGKVHHIVGEYGELFFPIIGACPGPVDRGEGHYFVVGGD